VAAQVPDHEAARSHDDRGDLVHRSDDDVALAAVFRFGLHLRRRSRSAALPGDMATSGGWLPVLSDRQLDPLLRAANDPHIALLHPHMDQGVAQTHTHRHQGRSDGEDTAEVEGEGGKNAGGGRDTVRPLVAAPLRHLRRDQARRRRSGKRGRDPADRHTDRSVVGRQQLLHKSDPLRLLQQEVPARLHRHFEKRSVLRQAQIL